jgi:hypothetical protein
MLTYEGAGSRGEGTPSVLLPFHLLLGQFVMGWAVILLHLFHSAINLSTNQTYLTHYFRDVVTFDTTFGTNK